MDELQKMVADGVETTIRDMGLDKTDGSVPYWRARSGCQHPDCAS